MTRPITKEQNRNARLIVRLAKVQRELVDIGDVLRISGFTVAPKFIDNANTEVGYARRAVMESLR